MDVSRFSGVSAALALIAAAALAADATGSTLDCTNDFEERMFCQFEAQNCAQHNVTLQSQSGYGDMYCVPHACDAGLCCCSVLMGRDLLIMGDSMRTTVWKDAEAVDSKVIDIWDNVKAKAPTIVSLRESNGNFQLRWKTNVYTFLVPRLASNVTYYKAGDTRKVSACYDLVMVDGLGYCEIAARALEPSTTYVVSVRSYTSWSGRYSDSSEEWTFTTDVSPRTVLLAVIVSLSVFAVAVTAATYGCYVQLKRRWWDAIAGPELLMHPKYCGLLKPEPIVVSSVDVIPAGPDESKSCSKLLSDSSGESSWQSSGINTGSSGLSYATTEPLDILSRVQNALISVFPNISPVSPAARCHVSDSAPSDPFDVGSTSSGSFDNRTYSMVVPIGPRQTAAVGSAYQLVGGDAEARAEQQAPPLLPTDMSYQQCKADSAYAGDSGSSSASRDLASGAEASACDGSPCWGGGVPAASLPVDVAYQAFQALVRQPDVWFPGQRCAGSRERLDRRPEESLAEIPAAIPGLAAGFPGDHGLPELRTPLTSAASSHRPIITNTGYQSV